MKKLSSKKIESVHESVGICHLYYSCKTLKDFLSLPNGIEFNGKIYVKKGFNGTHLAFYACKQNEPKAVDLYLNEFDLEINTGKHNSKGYPIYTKYRDYVREEERGINEPKL